VRLIKGKLARKDKEINDLRKKTEISENNFKRLRDEVQKL
jgi:DNA-binding Xre family transcriptional regulator